MRNKSVFRFKQFSIGHSQATMKVGTDGVLLGAWADVENATRILDVGTGSGVIALMLAQRTNPSTHIDAIDLSADDCAVAIENVKQSPWPQKVSVHHSALQDFVAAPYDLIVSNPPYFINSYKPLTEKRTQARHTETLPHNELLQHSRRLLTHTGTLSVILPETEALHLLNSAAEQGWFCKHYCTFRARVEKPVERLLLNLSLQPQPRQQTEIVLYSTGETWSDPYKKLTKDFYLKA